MVFVCRFHFFGNTVYEYYHSLNPKCGGASHHKEEYDIFRLNGLGKKYLYLNK